MLNRQPQKIRIQTNMPRHYQLKLYLKETQNDGTEVLKEIKTGSELGFEVYRQIEPYPYMMVTLDVPNLEHTKGRMYELIGQITHLSDHKWSEQVTNFPSWDKNRLTDTMEPTNEKIPIPIVSFIRLDIEDNMRTEVIEADFFKMYLNGPVTIDSLDTRLAIELSGEQFPVFVCLDLGNATETTTPIVALVSDYDKETGELLGNQLQYTDD